MRLKSYNALLQAELPIDIDESSDSDGHILSPASSSSGSTISSTESIRRAKNLHRQQKKKRPLSLLSDKFAALVGFESFCLL